jgi:dihydrofolate synthase
MDLALKRIYTLLWHLREPQLNWKAVHVAGTNGKGSVCAYISSCLKEAQIRCGRFTSPHLIDRWDCITIDGKTVEERVFIHTEKYVRQMNSDHQIGCTEFELLTATAFELFKTQKVEIGVIETGLGGRLDATNTLRADKTLVTAITKIGLDHQAFLGKTLGQIAREKAGIKKSRVPVVVDATNDQDVIKVIKEAGASSAPMVLARIDKPLPWTIDPSLSPLLGSYQKSNLATALYALSCISRKYPQVTQDAVEKGIKNTSWPGRLQWMDINSHNVLLDGAHNPEAAKLLGEYIDKNVRGDSGVTYIMAFSDGKEVEEILCELVRPVDRIIITSFGSVEGMPWVKPKDCAQVKSVANTFTENVEIIEDNAEALNWVDNSTVICGSLYLVGDVLRQLREVAG